MARRAVITLAATSAGVALVMSFKSPQTAGVAAGGSALGTLPDASATDQTVAPDTAAQPAPSTTAAAAGAPTTAPTSASSTTSTTAAAAGAAAAAKVTQTTQAVAAPTTAAPLAATTTTAGVVRTPSTTFLSTTTTTRPPAKGVPAGASGTFDGDMVTTRFGDVQVEISVTGGKIVDVTALALPSDRARSAAISQYAGPVLRQEALTAQTAAVDIVSGATYTSMGYAQSLQSAIDKA